MEKLPVEMLCRIFDAIFEENPADLSRCRAVCRDWKTFIDGYILTLYKKWHHTCVRDIPEDCIDSIVASKFPLAASPWKDSYWKTAQLPHIPRAIHKTWKSLRQFGNGKFKIGKIVEAVEEDVTSDLYCVDFTINDKYLAVAQQFTYMCRTDIYELADLTRPVRIYELRCNQIEFYTANDREFVIFTRISDSRMSEFLINRSIVSMKLDCGKLTIIENECFTHLNVSFTHYIFSDGCFKKNKTVCLPKQSFFDQSRPYIHELRINGSELLVFIELPESAVEAGNVRQPRDFNLCIFRYNILRGSNGNLDFSPHPTNFIQKVTHRRCDGWISTGRYCIERLPINARLHPIRFEFVRWLDTVFPNNNFIHFLTYADHVFAGTKSGKIFIFHHWTADEMIRDFTSKNFTVKKYTEINFSECNIPRCVMPIGITCTNSKLRIIFKNGANNYFYIDFSLISGKCKKMPVL